MAQYRCYFLDGRNHIISVVVINLPTDALACAEADKLWRASPHHGVELWNGAERIHRAILPDLETAVAAWDRAEAIPIDHM